MDLTSSSSVKDDWNLSRPDLRPENQLIDTKESRSTVSTAASEKAYKYTVTNRLKHQSHDLCLDSDTSRSH